MDREPKIVTSIEEIIGIVKQFPESVIFRGENNIYSSLKPKNGRLFDNFCTNNDKANIRDLSKLFTDYEIKFILTS